MDADVSNLNDLSPLSNFKKDIMDNVAVVSFLEEKIIEIFRTCRAYLHSMKVPMKAFQPRGEVRLIVDGEFIGSCIFDGYRIFYKREVDGEDYFSERNSGQASFGIADLQERRANQISIFSSELNEFSKILAAENLLLLLLIHECVHACMLVGQSFLFREEGPASQSLLEWISPEGRMREVHESFALYVTEKVGIIFENNASCKKLSLNRNSTSLYIGIVKDRLTEESGPYYSPYFSELPGISIRNLARAEVWEHQRLIYTPSFMDAPV